ncbi:hypothetical protein I2I05_18490 [Hymenobacter sp. BT683]|uniref:PorT family protein n=1 Tax=Hymenobacter jeongseonensis TaxID=2791027 RepID=A0ABS0ILY3_9BACT|nr:hypothetical protein [Hymenobacter jeongseonensis]MBF9239388.1 hypothetical protein [Hymenobacter jeongseonensis]
MLLRLLLLPAFLFYTFQTLAQAYEPGLLVRSNGDTLRGEIENGAWNEPPAFIRYRPSAESPSQLFQPRALRAVQFTKGRYFRYEILPIDHAANTRLDRLPVGNVMSVQTDSVLAEVLLEGTGSLFRVATFGSVHYLMQCPGQPVLDLCERKYLRTNARGVQELAEGNNYRSQLAVYFGRCPAANNLAQKAPFTPEALVAVMQAYNQECSASQQAGRRFPAEGIKRSSSLFQGGILAGLRYNRIVTPTDNPNTNCSDCKVRPFAGLYGELLMPGRSTAVYGELSTSYFSGKLAVNSGILNGGSSFVYNYYDYKAWLGTARIGVRYFIPLPHDQQLLFGLGLELNTVWRPDYATPAGQAMSAYADKVVFADPTLLPNLAVGWRTQRLTFSLDGQLYSARNGEGVFKNLVFGESSVLRFSTAYRLGRKNDAQTR